MEDVLEVYTRPYDARFPQICLDESGKQLIADKLEGLPMQPGVSERYDYSYEQGPMLNLFLACEIHYPNAEKIILVMDNLATHFPAAFYHAFPPAEARRLATKKELEHQVACWQEQRNAAATTVNWRFTTADARIKLKRLYPSLKTKPTNSEQVPVANDV